MTQTMKQRAHAPNTNPELLGDMNDSLSETGGIPEQKPEWKTRLLSLDIDRQRQIAVKYYGGHMPWKS